MKIKNEHQISGAMLFSSIGLLIGAILDQYIFACIAYILLFATFVHCYVMGYLNIKEDK